ncbi:MAG TPA: response regulator transcription factor [Acidimicrobiia bacterium]|nr:response regulator transcription factor [Acidimicrobiia bacterium]
MSTEPLLLIVDDEESYRDALSVALRREGFAVEVARDGVEALDRWSLLEQAGRPVALVLLDVMLPRMSGIDVCREIRAKSSVPIIMVTARDSEIDTVVGLEVGADDYVAKPFGVRELVARIRAALRRVPVEPPGGDGRTRADGVLEVEGVRLDPGRHEVTVDGAVVHLPPKEFELLELLLMNAGLVLSRDVLIDRVWGGDYVGDTKTLDVHIKRVRSKIEEDPADPRRITTIRGIGYRYERG